MIQLNHKKESHHKMILKAEKDEEKTRTLMPKCLMNQSQPARNLHRESWRKTKQTRWSVESAENESKKKIPSKILIRYIFQEADTETFQGILCVKHFCCIACKEMITENFCRLLVCICFGRLLTEGYGLFKKTSRLRGHLGHLPDQDDWF